jgi:RNA polymerase sigma factor (sigma-70 family)
MELYPYVYSIVRRKIGDMPDWEDVVQEVYCSSLASLERGQFEGRSSLKTWVYKIMMYKIRDALRGRWQLKEVLFYKDFDCSIEGQTFEQVYEENDLVEKFIKEFVISSPRTTQILRLLLSGWKTYEIAEILGLTYRCVWNHKHKGLIRLRHREGEINEFLG